MNNNEYMVYLYSNVSNSCSQVKPLIEQLMNISKIPIKSLNVDTKQVKEIIKNSKQIKINYVPSLILISKLKNKVEVYEGKEFITTVNSLIEAFTEIQKNELYEKQISEELNNSNQSNNNQNPLMKSKNTVIGKTSLLDILGEDNVIDKNKSSKKFGRTKLNMPNDVNPFSVSEDGRMLIGNIDQPIRGDGHDKMKKSSITEFGLVNDDMEQKVRFNEELDENINYDIDEFDNDDSNNFSEESRSVTNIRKMVQETPLKANTEKTKKVPVKIGKKVEMLEDLSSIFETPSEKPSENYGLEKFEGNLDDLRGEPSRKDEKTALSSATKMAAEQMMRDRERESSELNKRRR
jgi:hypothetical protein